MNIIELLHSALRVSTPLSLCALGGLFAYRAGVLNVAMEGMILMGAFTGVVASYMTGDPYIAVICSIIVSVLLGFVFSFFGITLKGNSIITGLAINITVTGITSFLLQVIFGRRGVLSDPAIVGFNPISIDFLDKIPFIGKIINNHTPLVYFSFIFFIICYYLLFKTKFGLYIRVVGENISSARSVGINTDRIQYGAIILGSISAALAGVNLSLENLTMFVEKMSGERGFIALAAIYCGRGNPLYVFTFTLLFGFAEALQIRVQGYNIPAAYVQMLPYIFIITVFSISGILKQKTRLERGVKDD